ncbi:carbohydrate ABC transporter permease [Phytoactinopolyspora limicola]|uniref:carbohydrate ABC transporter permease n=1 Tax=Phytoactinopolyspora limicola TaxID=2715536 RepID=UPI00140CFE1E|nr:carbohydrate ABC transporter permease [Phytoactinopolyspora limicola]
MVNKVIRPVFLSVLGLLWLVPVYLLIANASKLPGDYSSAEVWKPAFGGALLDNMRDVWERADLGSTVMSTLIYSVTGPLVGVLIGASVGFAIVALRLRHGFWWFVFIFGGTVFPLQMLLMPLFVGYAETGLYDTRIGLILVYTVISVPFSAFVMRNFFTGIAHHVFEAAVVDGASTWRIFWRIYLPMSKSAMVAVFILQATFIWNDLLLGLTLSQSNDVRPVMTALTALQSTYGGSAMPVVLAGGLLVSIPTVVLFLATQRIFSRGLALGQF